MLNFSYLKCNLTGLRQIPETAVYLLKDQKAMEKIILQWLSFFIFLSILLNPKPPIRPNLWKICFNPLKLI